MAVEFLRPRKRKPSAAAIHKRAVKLEARLKAEGLGVVSSIFDHADDEHAFPCVSREKAEDNGGSDWCDVVANDTWDAFAPSRDTFTRHLSFAQQAVADVFPEPFVFADHPKAAMWRIFAQAVETLPEEWPELERKFLRLVAETGLVSEAKRRLRIRSNSKAQAMLGRFAQWRKEQR